MLAEPVPGGASFVPPPRPLYDTHAAEIERLILALRRARPVLLARPQEDDDTYARAIEHGLSLTPRQLYCGPRAMREIQGHRPLLIGPQIRPSRTAYATA